MGSWRLVTQTHLNMYFWAMTVKRIENVTLMRQRNISGTRAVTGWKKAPIAWLSMCSHYNHTWLLWAEDGRFNSCRKAGTALGLAAVLGLAGFEPEPCSITTVSLPFHWGYLVFPHQSQNINNLLTSSNTCFNRWHLNTNKTLANSQNCCASQINVVPVSY